MKKNLNLIAQEEEPEVVLSDKDKIVLLKDIEREVKKGFDDLYLKRAESWVRLTADFGKDDVARRDCKDIFNAFKVVCGMKSSKSLGEHLDALSELRIAYRKLADYLESLVLCKYNDNDDEFPF